MKPLSQSWLVFTSDQALRTQLQHLDNKFIKFEVHKGGISDAILHLQHTQTTEHLIIELKDDIELEKYMHQLAEVCQEGTHLIALGQQDTIAWYKRLQALGADDYLVLPIPAEQLMLAIENLNTHDTATVPKKNSMLAILGARGGLGSTTLAVNYAWLMAEHHQFKTCLLDFDFYYGDINIHVNKTPNHGLSQALVNAERLDELFINRLTIEITDHLYLLSANCDFEQSVDYQDEAIIQFTNHIRNYFDLCIIDVPHGHLITPQSILTMASHLCIVADLSVTALRDTARIIGALKQYAPLSQPGIVVIKNTAAKSAELTEVQFEEGLGRSIDYLIPFDKNVTLTAHNLGKPLAISKPKHKMIQSIQAMIKAHHPDLPIQSLPWWKQWFKR